MRHSHFNRAGSKNRQRIALKITNRFIFDPLLSTRQNEGTSFFRLTDSAMHVPTTKIKKPSGFAGGLMLLFASRSIICLLISHQALT